MKTISHSPIWLTARCKSAYSIKEYSSAKAYDEFGNWQHEKIDLLPLNHDYDPIVINAEDAEDFRVIGEFVGTI